MSEIFKTEIVETKKIVGYKCDVCDKELEITPDIYAKYDLNEVKYYRLTGENSGETVIKHVCSEKCLADALQEVARLGGDVDIHMSKDLIKELLS